MNDFEKSLKSLSLEGVIAIIGLLSQRALELMAIEKTKVETPSTSLIL